LLASRKSTVLSNKSRHQYPFSSIAPHVQGTISMALIQHLYGRRTTNQGIITTQEKSLKMLEWLVPLDKVVATWGYAHLV
jgi:hypothetical protein